MLIYPKCLRPERRIDTHIRFCTPLICHFGKFRGCFAAGLDADVPLRNLQEAASRADPRSTMHYDRTGLSLDRHATYVVPMAVG